jgi:(1->4)-alpha-D-glucan 1-alpha-D-glucosylmutase
MYRVPLATYRLQFNSGFTFDSARRIASYLAELGISDIYASPILKARKGSPHGYDVVDAATLNPELGSDDDFNALHDELRRHELGLLLDVVPNHMAASAENAWWMSVLENGPRSRFMHYFDVDANPKVLLPILGRPYGEALEAREIQLGFDRDGFFFNYYEHRLPLAPESYRLILRDVVDASSNLELHELVQNEEAASNSKFLKETIGRIYEQDAGFREALERAIVGLNGDVDRLDALLDAQWYRLAYWRIASEKINYRRFFDVTDLVGVRVENPEVFEARNRRTLELIAEGKVTGLRIDHIDGLYDPVGHMRKLQSRIGDEPFYIVVEKILSDDEQLPREFPVSGTTGYDFLSTLNNLFIDGAGLAKLDEFYRSFTGVTHSFKDIEYERKKQVIHELFSGEMRRLGKPRDGRPQRARLLAGGARDRAHRGDGVPGGVPDVHPRRRGERGGPRDHRARAELCARAFRRGARSAAVHVPGARSARRSAGIRRGGTARSLAGVRHAVAAVHRTRDGEGRRGHGVLQLQPAPDPERGRRRPRPRAAARRARRVPPAQRADRARLARHAQCDLHA